MKNRFILITFQNVHLIRFITMYTSGFLKAIQCEEIQDGRHAAWTICLIITDHLNKSNPSSNKGHLRSFLCQI